VASKPADTIFALSSGRVPAGIAVIRMSGPGSADALRDMCGTCPPARLLEYRPIRDRNGDLLDRGLVVHLPGPESFTGEDCAELHVHGGKAVVKDVLSELAGRPGFRLAEAGEFSKRAFLNGKLDLTSADALADLIEADTSAQRRFALGHMQSGNRRLYSDWSARLLSARALVEADLDFSDQDDVGHSAADAAWPDLAALARDMDAHVARFRSAEIMRDGLKVAIVGAPNVGKSSLINALAQRDVAIVSDEAGTTRDVVEVALDLDGYKVVVADTAGLREAEGNVEREGVRRALDRAREADLVLHVIDLSFPRPNPPDIHVPLWTVGNKADLISGGSEGSIPHVSARTGEGIGPLLDRIGEFARSSAAETGDVVPFTLRQRGLVEEAIGALSAAIHSTEAPLEVRAEWLRQAGQALGRITGTVDVEDLLGAVFSRFCVGK
jgi:tRNA modification GTPase